MDCACVRIRHLTDLNGDPVGFFVVGSVVVSSVAIALDPLSLDLLPLDPFALDQLSLDEFLLVYLCISDVVGRRGHKLVTKYVVYMVKNIIQCRKGRMSRMSTDNGRKSEDRANSQFISSQYSLKKLESHPILSICSRLLVAIWLLWNPERSWIV